MDPCKPTPALIITTVHSSQKCYTWKVVIKVLFMLGKTTLVDSLVASNGIISQRQAGKVVQT